MKTNHYLKKVAVSLFLAVFVLHGLINVISCEKREIDHVWSGADDVDAQHRQLKLVSEQSGVETAPVDAVLFPCFILAVTVVMFYLISRYAKWMSYMGMCFVLGYENVEIDFTLSFLFLLFFTIPY